MDLERVGRRAACLRGIRQVNFVLLSTGDESEAMEFNCAIYEYLHGREKFTRVPYVLEGAQRHIPAIVQALEGGATLDDVVEMASMFLDRAVVVHSKFVESSNVLIVSIIARYVYDNDFSYLTDAELDATLRVRRRFFEVDPDNDDAVFELEAAESELRRRLLTQHGKPRLSEPWLPMPKG